jgi:hypothetical protein
LLADFVGLLATPWWPTRRKAYRREVASRQVRIKNKILLTDVQNHFTMIEAGCVLAKVRTQGGATRMVSSSLSSFCFAALAVSPWEYYGVFGTRE